MVQVEGGSSRSGQREVGSRWTQSNNGMHPTADTRAVINLRGAARRVMPGVRSPECAGLIRRAFHPGAGFHL